MPFHLDVDGVSKSFQGVRALREVGLTLRGGRVVGLVGQNGAGKSTLMNVLGGVVQPDAGRMALDGEPYDPRTSADAAAAGIAFIHQELNLFPNLSIADNLFIDRFPRRGRAPFIDRKAARARARELLDAVGLPHPPETPVERLAPGEQQLVEIAHALSRDARFIIFDEPTTSLTSRETERLFDLVGQLRAEGKAVVFISHTLTDVLRLADDVVVLRDGERVAAGEASAFSVERLITEMVGRRLEQRFPERTSEPSGEAILEVRGLSQPGVVRDVGLTLHRGEVVGLFGLMGSGRTELARILFGLDPFSQGEILLGGRPIGHLPTRERIRRGLAFVSENRREEGLLMEATVVENAGLASLRRYARTPLRFLDRRRLRERVEEVADALGVRRGSLDRHPVKSLSGGNQQKVVLGKWLLSEPSVFILDEPTRGIDVAAKYDVYALVADLAARGAAVLCISSEIEELVGLCDRLLVMHEGEIAGRFGKGAFDEPAILRAAFGEPSDG